MMSDAFKTVAMLTLGKFDHISIPTLIFKVLECLFFMLIYTWQMIGI
jgi:hypothetical protein